MSLKEEDKEVVARIEPTRQMIDKIKQYITNNKYNSL